MFKIKQITSLLAVVAVLFGFATESFAAKKSKTLKNIPQNLLGITVLGRIHIFLIKVKNIPKRNRRLCGKKLRGKKREGKISHIKAAFCFLLLCF